MERTVSDQTVLEVTNLKVAFNNNPVIDGLDFEVKKGEVLAIVGPNGAGKSVLFRTLLGLTSYTGSIKWGKNIKIGYVPQKLHVDSNLPLSIGDFLGFKSKSLSAIGKALTSVGIATDHRGDHNHRNFLNKKLGILSGGQLQRVLIAWSILDNPDVLLFDEPTAGIDVGGEETIYNLLHELQDSSNLTVILISHDLNIVYKYADNVLCLNKKQICFGIPNEVLDPKSLSSLYGGEAKFFHHNHKHPSSN